MKARYNGTNDPHALETEDHEALTVGEVYEVRETRAHYGYVHYGIQGYPGWYNSLAFTRLY